jgi:hypothetical protein
MSPTATSVIIESFTIVVSLVFIMALFSSAMAFFGKMKNSTILRLIPRKIKDIFIFLLNF